MERKLLLFLLILIQITVRGQNTSSTGYDKFRIGGYGEILYQNMDYGPNQKASTSGSLSENRLIVDLPRFILSFDYKFRSDIELSAEIEFEHGGTGSALELEYEEFGEYEMEMEKAGEVVLEQFHITKTFSRAFKVRLGHMIIPVGITNSRHLPIEYFGTVRPEGERSILPLTWHETGLAILGNYKKWTYEFQLVNGLDANGFSSENWIRPGKQAIFETTKMTDPAFVARIENYSIDNLRIAGSFYRGNSTGNTAKPEKMDHLDGTVTIGSFDSEYNNGRLIVRGNLVYGDLSDSFEISKINKGISKNIQYPRTSVASNALTYSLEAGYNVFKNKTEKLIPFVRYEYYNSMEETEGGIHADARFKRDVFTVGVNYYLLPNIALKLDYSSRSIDRGNYNTENTIGLALVYAGWFVSK